MGFNNLYKKQFKQSLVHQEFILRIINSNSYAKTRN